MIEYGLSVSLNGTPRSYWSPRTPPFPWNHDDDNAAAHLECCGGGDGVGAPPRKRMKFAEIVDMSEDDGSISPRILFAPSDSDNDGINENVRSFPLPARRRLDFSFSESVEELSPVSLSSSGGDATDDTRVVYNICDNNCCCPSCSVGECCVCYTNLPLRANHIFTMCGHLFCVRCLLQWWDTSSTCPMCRAELYQVEAAEEAVEEAAEAAASAEAAAEEGLWMRREFWNGRFDRLIETDDDDDDSISV